jgi:hypothetical protein
MSRLSRAIRSSFHLLKYSKLTAKVSQRILVACFPKSGSSYLVALIGNLPNFSTKNYVPYMGRREQELSETSLIQTSVPGRQVAHVHVRASEHTLHLIDKYRIAPIVLVRNIFDTVVSLADHIKTWPAMPAAYLDERISSLSFEDRIDALIDLAVPWYFNFYVSWWHARPDAIVTYEDLVLGNTLRKTSYLQSRGIETNLAEVTAAHELTKKQDTKLNVGTSGRGLKLIDKARRLRIERLASYYPEVDFSKIGIEN